MPDTEVTEQIRIKQFHTLFEVQFPYLYDFPGGKTHNFWEIVYVLEGTLSVTVESHVYTLSAGDVVFHKPLEFHKLFVPNPEGAHLIFISFIMEGPYASEFKNKIYTFTDEQKEIMKRFHQYLKVFLIRNTVLSAGFGISHITFQNFIGNSSICIPSRAT